MTGGGGHAAQPAEVYESQPAAGYGYGQQNMAPQNPCATEIRNFLECAQNQTDLTLCDGFNEVLRQCRLSYSEFFFSLSVDCEGVCFFHCKLGWKLAANSKTHR